MFEFYWPWMGLLLFLPLLVRHFWPRFVTQGEERPEEGRRTTLLHPSIQSLQDSFNTRRPRTAIAGNLHALLLALLWIFLTLAAMRPQWLEAHTEIKQAGYDLMLAVDTSRSMTALDFSRNNKQVSRMAVVKGVMGRFIANREGDRVGLVIFGSQAFVQSPLTLDLQAVRHILNTIEPRMAGSATAMGDAMGLSIKKLRERPKGSRVLLLITDGESTAGLIPPLEAARLARREGVRIYAIGVGSKKEQVLIQKSSGQGYELAEDIGLDEKTLRMVTKMTGGDYFRATNTHALEEIYKQINSMEKTETVSHSVLIPRPLFRWPLGAALLVLLILGLFPEGRMRIPGGTASA